MACRLYRCQTGGEQLCGVLYSDAGQVPHLLSAGDSGGDQDLVRFERAGGRQLATLANLSRDVEVLTRVAEGSGHATASRVEVDDLGARDPPEQRSGRWHQPQRCLVAWPCSSSRDGPAWNVSSACPSFRVPSSHSSKSRHASATSRASRDAVPRSSAGRSSRSAERQLGSSTTIRLPAAASGCSCRTVSAARRLASGSRPWEMSGRAQQTSGPSSTPTPARWQSARAAIPISGW